MAPDWRTGKASPPRQIPTWSRRASTSEQGGPDAACPSRQGGSRGAPRWEGASHVRLSPVAKDAEPWLLLQGSGEQTIVLVPFGYCL